MVAGHLQEKNGIYYVVLTYKTYDGKRKTKWQSTGLPIRFHDLRHSCASLLLANGVPMKMIQEWLGHSDFSTTANIYSHLDYASKVSSAEAMLNGLGMGSNPGNDT